MTINSTHSESITHKGHNYKVTVKCPSTFKEADIKRIATESIEAFVNLKKEKSLKSLKTIDLTFVKKDAATDYTAKTLSYKTDAPDSKQIDLENTPAVNKSEVHSIQKNLEAISHIFSQTIAPAPPHSSHASSRVEAMADKAIVPVGLNNPGSQCFMNASMQMLMHSKDSRTWLKELMSDVIRNLQSSPPEIQNPHHIFIEPHATLSPENQAIELVNKGRDAAAFKDYVELSKQEAAQCILKWINDYESQDSSLTTDGTRSDELRRSILKLGSSNPKFGLYLEKENPAKHSGVSLYSGDQEDADELMHIFLSLEAPGIASPYTMELSHTSVVTQDFGTREKTAKDNLKDAITAGPIPEVGDPKEETGVFLQSIRMNPAPGGTAQTLQDLLDVGIDGSLTKNMTRRYQDPKDAANVHEFDSEHTYHLKSAPKELYMRLNQFAFDEAERKTVKTPHALNTKSLDVKLTLESNDQVLYELSSIVCHRGESANSGHYFSYIKEADGNWRKYNDGNVAITVSADEILAILNGTSGTNIKDQTPYVLRFSQKAKALITI